MSIRIDGTNTAANPGITGADADTGLQFGTDEVSIVTGGTDRVKVDSSGRLLVGTSSARSNFFNTSSFSGLLQIEGTSESTRVISFVHNTSGQEQPLLVLGKSRGTAAGSNTAVQNNDNLGTLSFQGADGTELVEAARIEAVVDGTSGANDMPGRLVFSTTADGASSPTEHGRITSKGVTKFTDNGSYQDSTSGSYEFYHGNGAENGILIRNASGSFAATNILITNNRAASTAYNFGTYYSSGFSDTEFYFRGDGVAAADGSWNGGGADYAEYFEWSDGNPDDEDRRGISVVLNNDKIRPALIGEDPIGVISGNPSVVGDAAWNKWKGKHLRDDYGSYILDQNGERQLNPDYNPDTEYVPREDRSEWDCVGLIGKLRIRKGQVTGARWIKMRDVSDTVEEWLVR